MDALEKIINDLSDAVSSASDSFNSNIDGIQKQIYDDVELLVKNLDITNGKLDNTVNNIKSIGAIKGKIEKIILNPDYIDSVKSYTDAFNAVSKLQDSYFREMSSVGGPQKLLNAIKQQSVEFTVSALTENGISANVSEGIRGILKRNITGGASYNDLLDQIRNFILTNDTGTGALEKYTKQITTDSLQQFSRQYGQVMAADLDMEWFMYVGSNRKTSREFCILLTKKRWIHRSEFGDIVNGLIDGTQIKINPNTHTWPGGYPGTDENNLQANCGGYSCEHSMYPISESMVPGNIRAKFDSQISDVIKKANEAAPELDNIANTIADKHGATVTPTQIKGLDSLIRKATLEYGGVYSRVTDAVRNTIVANKNIIDKIIAEFEKVVGHVRTKPQNTPMGYTGNIVNIETANGLIGEIQVNTPKMIYAKNSPDSARAILGNDLYSQIAKETGLEGGLGHKYYEQWRLLDQNNEADLKRMIELEKLSNQYYSHFSD